MIRRMLNACGMVIDDTMPSIVGFLDKNIRISVDKTPIVDADVASMPPFVLSTSRPSVKKNC